MRFCGAAISIILHVKCTELIGSAFCYLRLAATSPEAEMWEGGCVSLELDFQFLELLLSELCVLER